MIVYVVKRKNDNCFKALFDNWTGYLEYARFHADKNRIKVEDGSEIKRVSIKILEEDNLTTEDVEELFKL
jgi:hypothetical protein